MGSQNETCTLLNGKAQCGKRFADAGVVGNHAVLERHVEVHADEDTLPAEIEVFDGELVHGRSLCRAVRRCKLNVKVL